MRKLRPRQLNNLPQSQTETPDPFPMSPSGQARVTSHTSRPHGEGGWHLQPSRAHAWPQLPGPAAGTGAGGPSVSSSRVWSWAAELPEPSPRSPEVRQCLVRVGGWGSRDGGGRRVGGADGERDCGAGLPGSLSPASSSSPGLAALPTFSSSRVPFTFG